MLYTIKIYKNSTNYYVESKRLARGITYHAYNVISGKFFDKRYADSRSGACRCQAARASQSPELSPRRVNREDQIERGPIDPEKGCLENTQHKRSGRGKH